MNSHQRVLSAIKHRQPDWVPIDLGGTCDCQGTLAFGTPQQVAAEVAESLRVFAPGGGFVLAPVHNIIQAEVTMPLQGDNPALGAPRQRSRSLWPETWARFGRDGWRVS